jgi:uncharacterized protein with ParB-like and HNH nuclease domain
MKITIENDLTTSKENYFSYPFKTFKNQNSPTNIFTIPLQQRDYDWPNGEGIRDLLTDLDIHLNNLGSQIPPGVPATMSDYYYAGTILCENQNSNSLKLIDGQQRITTLFLLNFTGYLLSKYRLCNIPLCDPRTFAIELSTRFTSFVKWEQRCFIKNELSDNILDYLNNENSSDDKISYTLLERIGSADASPSVNYWPKLKPRLNYDDQDTLMPRFMNTILESEIQITSGEINYSYTNERNQYSSALAIILDYFRTKARDWPNITVDKSIENVILFLEYYISHLAMTCIISDNCDDSFVLFEILNERGEDVTALDLLKNLILEKERSSGLSIPDFKNRWFRIKKNVKESCGTKADSVFVKFLIRSESSTIDRKHISYLRNINYPSQDLRNQIFINELVYNFFLRVEKISEILHQIHINQKTNNSNFSSPFDNHKHSCFQYTTFMRMIGYDWGQEVVIGSNILHLVSSNYNSRLSLNDNHNNNWIQTNSSSVNPDLKHFQRFLGDILLKVGLVGMVNSLSSGVLPLTSKNILRRIIAHSETYGANCANPQNLRQLIEEIKAEAQSGILNSTNKANFELNLKNRFTADTVSRRNLTKIILFIIYTRQSSISLDCPELEHFEPTISRVSGPPYYNKGDRALLINKIGNFFLIDRQINNRFLNKPIYEKLQIANTEFPMNPIINTNLFKNIDYSLPIPIISDQIHGSLPLIKKATSAIPEFDDSFELNDSPTEYFFTSRTNLISNLASYYIFDSINFIHTNSPY